MKSTMMKGHIHGLGNPLPEYERLAADSPDPSKWEPETRERAERILAANYFDVAALESILDSDQGVRTTFAWYRFKR